MILLILSSPESETKSDDFRVLDHKQCGYVMYCWKSWSDVEEVKKWVDRLVTDPNRAMRLLRHLVSISIVNGVKRVPFFDGQAAEEFVDLKTSRKSVAAVPPEQRT